MKIIENLPVLAYIALHAFTIEAWGSEFHQKVSEMDNEVRSQLQAERINQLRLEEEAQQRAATSIQKITRGYLARKENARLQAAQDRQAVPEALNLSDREEAERRAAEEKRQDEARSNTTNNSNANTPTDSDVDSSSDKEDNDIRRYSPEETAAWWKARVNNFKQFGKDLHILYWSTFRTR